MRDFFARQNYGAFDHQRMLEDLRATAHLFAQNSSGTKAIPPAAFLQRLGSDILDATAEDFGALALKRDTAWQRQLDAQVYGRCFGGRLTVSWLAASIILGRRDLRGRFMQGSLMSWEAGMQWLVLHGANEHQLVCRENAKLISELLLVPRPASASGESAIRVLDIILRRERPDKHVRSAQGAHFQAWAETTAIRDYSLYWLFKTPTSPPHDHDS